MSKIVKVTLIYPDGKREYKEVDVSKEEYVVPDGCTLVVSEHPPWEQIFEPNTKDTRLNWWGPTPEDDNDE